MARFGLCIASMFFSSMVMADTEGFGPQTTGEINFSFSLDQADYSSRRFTLDGNVTRLVSSGDVSGEVFVDKEYLRVNGQKTELNRDKYDANVKWRSFFSESRNYTYLSPRWRHNSFGYYQTSIAMRAGLGRQFEPTEDLSISLELGTGYRVAWLETDDRVKEPLFTVATKMSWQITDSFTTHLTIVNEQSNRETYRTVEAKLRNKLTEAFSMQYEISYTRAFPFDSFDHGAETNAEVGLVYSF